MTYRIGATEVDRAETVDLILLLRCQPSMCFIIESPTIKIFFLLLSLFCFYERFLSPAFLFLNYHFGDPLIYGFIHILIWYTFSAIIAIFFQVAFSCGLVFEVTSFCVWVSSWCILTVNVVSATFSLFWILRYIFCLIFTPEIPYLFF